MSCILSKRMLYLVIGKKYLIAEKNQAQRLWPWKGCDGPLEQFKRSKDAEVLLCCGAALLLI